MVILYKINSCHFSLLEVTVIYEIEIHELCRLFGNYDNRKHYSPIPWVPVWNPCFVHAGCTPENIVACAKTKIDVKALDFLAPTLNSREISSTLDVTSMLCYA